MPSISKRGARQVTNDIDRIASLVSDKFEVLGIPEKVATDFVRRLDFISDQIERTAGMEPGQGDASNGGFNPNEVGEKEVGPHSHDSDESYMTDEFTQKEFSELHDAVTKGEQGLGSNKAASDDEEEEDKKEEDKEESDKEASIEANLQEARKLASDMVREAADSISKMPGFSPMQLRQKIDQLSDIENELTKIAKEYEDVLKKMKGLEKEHKAGVSALKKAASEMREKGKYVVEAKKGLLEFTAYLQDKRPGIEQMIATEETVKSGQKAGDFFGRIAAKLGQEVSEQVATIYEETKEDLTHTKMAVRGLKIVTKTAGASEDQLRTAGLADTVVSIKEWLADKADSVTKTLFQFAGGVMRWVKGFIERTKMVGKASDSLKSSISDAEKMIDDAMKAAKAASEDKDSDEGKEASHGYDLFA